LLVGNSITLNYTGGTIPSLSSDTTFTGTYIVASTPSKTTFTIKDSIGTIYAANPLGDMTSFVGAWSTPAVTTASISATGTSTEVQTALAALLGSSNVIVGGGNGSFSVQFVNALGNVEIPAMDLSSSISVAPYKQSSLSLTGSALQHAMAAGNILLEVATLQNGFTTTLAQTGVTVKGSVQNGTGNNATSVGDSTRVPFPAMVLGADYSFGILPRDGVTKLPLDLTNASLSATLHTGPVGPQIAAMNVTMPTQQGNSILCILPAAQTAGITVTENNSTFWVKLLLTNYDGSVTPLGSGFVQVNPA
jgi:hypothetical protein